ncbi:AraC family transcriptional regulator [Devosia oryziradicis]|uniref:AraC family transcriptional regulator n=1 Tax=Devosia oryziradicis TaxID=2801335 RepID=A0ABX7BW08_9HYPH|nr:AraC family transcriptional regulator [Devosia oryziradicis]QQR34797.1 AraC family transcriptional regulator [Devosia oryziradicis]
MQFIERAIWFIETRFADDITLDDIANIGGVSRFHLSRSFGTMTGQSVMTYVRGRRLTLAAQKLLDGAPDILSVALDVGYASHEAFTRAFRDHFGQTPEQMRAHGIADPDLLVAPLRIDETLLAALPEPRIVDAAPLRVAGFSERYTFATNEGIPALWQRFSPYVGHMPGQVGSTTYGVVADFEDDCSFGYLAGVEVLPTADLDEGMAYIDIPAQRYAVFAHEGHISTMRRTAYSIWAHYFPTSTLIPTGGPSFERYGAEHDAQTGHGLVEVWVPVAR